MSNIPPNPYSRRSERRQHLDQLLAAGLISSTRYREQSDRMKSSARGSIPGRAKLRNSALSAHRQVLAGKYGREWLKEKLSRIREECAHLGYEPIPEAEDNYTPPTSGGTTYEQ